MNKLKAMTVFGTRPDAIKMAPLVKELKKHKQFHTEVCVTAQHRQMLDQVLDVFGIIPDYDLNIMHDKQTLEHITTKSLEGLSSILEKSKPDVVLVHGDTTTCFAASLAAFYKKIPVGHVEAGLRTFDRYYPFPEEMNRRLTDVLADFYFAPTFTNKTNLLNEGISEDRIFVCGNTVIDALKTTTIKNYSFQNKILRTLDVTARRIIVAEAHRRENLGEPLENICLSLKYIADKYNDILIIFPVHLNPHVQEITHRILKNHDQILLIDPLSVLDMHNLINKSYMVITDSGGLQEESPSLGKPVLVLRNETERPEAVEAGTVKLAGTEKEKIATLTEELLNNSNIYNKMTSTKNPYGDGNASERIIQSLLYKFNMSMEKPDEFIPYI